MTRRATRLTTTAAALAILAGGALAQAASPATKAQATAGRVRQIFNADWRFHLGDVAGGADPSLDDRQWRRVGLPHSFSQPYFRSPSFYVGHGWYRKAVTLERLAPGRRYWLEFEGAFQDAEVFVNGASVGRHRGGYTGFSLDITAKLKPGANLVAVRLNNQWDPTLAPRAGEHVFSGGLYRDVWLVAADEVHVTWTGTRITTPALSAVSGQVQAETEIRNDGAAQVTAEVRSEVRDAQGRVTAKLPDQTLLIAPAATVTATQRSAAIATPKLWSPETPTLYHVTTHVFVQGVERDRYDTEFGFRWFAWTPDRGFFLNGQHRYFRGANVHQDQAGWGDAVTNAAIDRDVQLIKDAGFDFIRGSHYPHDPHFAEATDRIGLLYLSEAPFWGTAGFNNPWGASAYPTDPAQEAAFEASVKQQLAEMIRINRNHPSIIAWGMDNEVFFTAQETLPKVRRLLQDEVALTHQLDPTRPASVDGAQRGEIDHLGDVAGYNGDGAVLFPNPGIANFVGEYGSTMADRPGPYEPGWGDIEHTPGAKPGEPDSWRLPWRSGEAIWAGFDHGSIAGRAFGGMGMVDYQRLPKHQWYWYRNAYRGVAPPVWPKPGQAAALRLSASAPVIRRADGTDDVQLVVTVVDAAGKPVSNSPPVHLAIEAGPGELPTGRAIDFAPQGDINIRDGQAAIALRSWQAGVSRLRATSPGLRDGVLEIRTLSGPPFVPGVTPLAENLPYVSSDPAVDKPGPEQTFGRDNPITASCSAKDHPANLANDADPASSWTPCADETRPWLILDPERVIKYRQLKLVLSGRGGYRLLAETKDAMGYWHFLAEQTGEAGDARVLALETAPVEGRELRLTFTRQGAGQVGVADLQILGTLSTR